MKVTVGIGGTFSLGEESREFIRPYVEITDIDPEGDVADQIEKARPAIDKVWDEAVKILVERVKKIRER